VHLPMSSGLHFMAPAHEQLLNIRWGHSLRRTSLRSSEGDGTEVVTYQYQELDQAMQVVARWEVEELVQDRPPHATSWQSRRLDAPMAESQAANLALHPAARRSTLQTGSTRTTTQGLG
jgi:hypothetical protein